MSGVDELEKLVQMYKDGYLTQEEFESMKAKISDFKSQDNQKEENSDNKANEPDVSTAVHIADPNLPPKTKNKKFIRYFLFSLPAVAVVLGLLGYYYNQNQDEMKCYFGSGESCNALGDKYSSGKDVKVDSDKANEYYEKGCELDNGQACFSLGFNYENGIGLDSNINKANEIYQKGCNLDSGVA